MRLIVISSPDPIAMEHAHVNEMFKRGLQTFHLRKPGCTKAVYQRYLQGIEPAFLSSIVLHEHHELVREYGLKGRHYTSCNCPSLPITIKSGLSSSLSLHDLSQLDQPLGALDYVFLSPIFDSISKKGYQAAFTHDELQTAVSASDIPVIALGGVTADNLSIAASLGFRGAAVLGRIWQCGNPVKEFESLVSVCSCLGQDEARL